ncbi:MAG: S-layer homology domain-containing protein, partial [Schwartzia sp.]|nr:S-layer homology domain-containing protein [Schwartzia sp. (in: firmicutes)]
DHWAYDAIAQLAADGVIEGYGDGTYRGDQEITRYEMAQMVARAMAKGGGNKALLDKLAAEFADELNNLGVRVPALEKKVDNVKWNGLVRWEYYNYWNENKNNSDPNGHHNAQYYKLRFQPKLTINEHWFGSARIDYNTDADTAANVPARVGSYDWNGFQVDRIWVQGEYDNLTIKLGKPHFVSSYEGHGGGMVYDTRVAGGYVTVGNKLKLTLGGGRKTGPESVMLAELGGDVSDKFGAGVGFYRVSSETTYGENGSFYRSYDSDPATAPAANVKSFGSNNRNIWKVGFDWKFAPKWMFNAAYARSNGNWETKFKQAYTFEVSYNGGRYTDFTKPGSFGAFLAYRHIGAGAVIAPVYDGMCFSTTSQKGIEVGVSYTPVKNVLATFIYFNGKDMGVTEDRKAQQLYGCLDFFF